MELNEIKLAALDRALNFGLRLPSGVLTGSYPPQYPKAPEATEIISIAKVFEKYLRETK